MPSGVAVIEYDIPRVLHMLNRFAKTPIECSLISPGAQSSSGLFDSVDEAGSFSGIAILARVLLRADERSS